MYEYKKRLDLLDELLAKAMEVVDIPALKQEVVLLEGQMQSPGFWDDAAKASEISKKAAALKEEYEVFEDLDEQIKVVMELVKEESGSEAEFEKMVTELEQSFDKLQIATFFTGEFDRNNAVLTVICGLGGKDAQDFTKIIAEMYQGFCEHFGFECQVLNMTYAEAGLKSMAMKITGPYAYGWLKFEHGVHRLIRLSPFNSGNTRETSFVMVDVLPEIQFNENLKIDENDLRIDVYKSSGPGGQSVNTTDSAVRITHLPTGISAACQNERSQHQNKENAMNLIVAKLAKLMHEKQAQTLDDLRGHKHEISFGSQIRTYTMHPYQLVKDHRTNLEIKNIESVLNGNIEAFLRSELENLSEIR